MKNLTRVLVLALVFSMIISTVAFGATFTDVEAGTPVAEATDVLAALGILKGYEDGTFGPDKVITRAEVVAVANRLQGLSEAAKGAAGTTIYTDVAADAWYAGDVNLATQMGIISGDGNGLFRPEDSVKYEEAVKIMVAALGYQNNYVMAKGGWPTGYLVIASEAGVTKGITAGAGQDAYRGIVARLAYNSIDAPMMVSDGYNSDGTYQYKAKEDKQLGYDKLGVYKFDAVVTTTSLVANSNLDTDEVKVNVVGDYGIIDTNFWTKSGDSYVAKTALKLEGATDVANYLGYTVTLFAKENDMGALEVVAMTVPAKKNSTVSFEDATLFNTTGTTSLIANANTDKLNYVDDEADFDEEYNLSYDITHLDNGQTVYDQRRAKLYINGVEDATPTVGDIALGGKVTLLDNNDDDIYDYIFVTRYLADVVEDIYDDDRVIGVVHGTPIDLTEAIKGKKGYAYTITLDGEAIDVADLKEDDVISVANAGQKVDIIVSRNIVTGTIEELDATNNIYVIDGTEYEIAGGLTSTQAGMNNVRAGDEGDFYIDAFGKIAKFERTKTTASNYGFILGIGTYTSVGTDAYEIKLLAKDGSVTTYELAERVTTNLNATGTAYGTSTKVNDEIVYTWATGANYLADEAHTLDAQTNEIPEVNEIYAVANPTANMLDNYAARMVTFKVNADGKVSTLYFSETGANKEFTLATTSQSSVYVEKTQSFDDEYYVTEDTIIFDLPIRANVTSSDFGIEVVSSLDEDRVGGYEVAMLDVDEDTYQVGAMVVLGLGAGAGAKDNLAVFLKSMTASDDMVKVTFMQGGEEKTVNLNTLEETDIFTGLEKGTLFSYALNAEGTITNAAIVLDVDTAVNSGGVSFKDYDDATWATTNAINNGSAYNFGFVKDKAAGNIITLAKANEWSTTTGFEAVATPKRIAIPEDATITLVDLTKASTSSTRVKAGNYANIVAASHVVEAGSAIIKSAANDVAVFVKYFKGDILDVVVVKGLADSGYTFTGNVVIPVK